MIIIEICRLSDAPSQGGMGEMKNTTRWVPKCDQGSWRREAQPLVLTDLSVLVES